LDGAEFHGVALTHTAASNLYSQAQPILWKMVVLQATDK
jgi:hypothetical protein